MPDLKITLCPPPDGLNKMLRMHWAARGRLNRGIALDVLCQVRGNKAGRAWIGNDSPVTISATRYASRALDCDNYAGSLKGVLDALVACRIIEDDSPAYLSIGALDQQRPGRGEVARLELTVSRRLTKEKPALQRASRLPSTVISGARRRHTMYGASDAKSE